MIPAALLQRRIDQGQGRTRADLVIRNVQLLDLVTGDLLPGDIAITGDTIVGTLGAYDGVAEIDGRGRVAVPGFIDTHLHVESSMVTPFEFERHVLPLGVTTAICDPHEMANVLGTAALDYFLASSERMVMDLRVALPSCVPATTLETAGASLGSSDLLPYRTHPKVIGLAEFMNFPGVLGGDPWCLEKLEYFVDGHIDGHAPLLRGSALNAYIAAGIRTDHEATSADEALEKVRKGMTVLIREGSVCKDLDALTPLLTPQTSPFFAFCTDDRNPCEIEEEGHLDYLVRRAIANGVEPVAAYRAATLSAATAFGLTDRGMIAPGRRADIVLLDDLHACRVSEVVCAGRPVTPALFATRETPPLAALGNTVHLDRPISAHDLAVRDGRRTRPVIGIIPGQIITENLALSLPTRAGAVVADPGQDISKVCVVERHGRLGSIGRGFVRGFGLRTGALASSVGHDSHNICVIGQDDGDMALAVNRLSQIGGGLVVVRDGRVMAEFPLPIAGLMSDQPFAHVSAALTALGAAAHELGVTLPQPFLQLAFLALPVIPHLKITDKGLVDVDTMTFV
ncbi:adenine deaminase [Ameyamaea chiangmaiensis NBRC 103196]|nr:adenine deaminase [Ameyamaea chiangmaiensis]MBS4074442.1 adenine deaminase [Ameyamaea chiangmaiensis]GBQ72055.1 adenine deaminase [Ameyamaea chiangmaiensis NBRC 103196]